MRARAGGTRHSNAYPTDRHSVITPIRLHFHRRLNLQQLASGSPSPTATPRGIAPTPMSSAVVTLSTPGSSVKIAVSAGLSRWVVAVDQEVWSGRPQVAWASAEGEGQVRPRDLAPSGVADVQPSLVRRLLLRLHGRCRSVKLPISVSQGTEGPAARPGAPRAHTSTLGGGRPPGRRIEVRVIAGAGAMRVVESARHGAAHQPPTGCQAVPDARQTCTPVIPRPALRTPRFALQADEPFGGVKREQRLGSSRLAATGAT